MAWYPFHFQLNNQLHIYVLLSKLQSQTVHKHESLTWMVKNNASVHYRTCNHYFLIYASCLLRMQNWQIYNFAQFFLSFHMHITLKRWLNRILQVSLLNQVTKSGLDMLTNWQFYKEPCIYSRPTFGCWKFISVFLSGMQYKK